MKLPIMHLVENFQFSGSSLTHNSATKTKMTRHDANVNYPSAVANQRAVSAAKGLCHWRRNSLKRAKKCPLASNRAMSTFHTLGELFFYIFEFTNFVLKIQKKYFKPIPHQHRLAPLARGENERKLEDKATGLCRSYQKVDLVRDAHEELVRRGG